MEAQHQYTIPVPISLCDWEGRLSAAEAFTLFMDAAAIHAQQLGVGADAMFAKGLFWLTVKTKVEILDRPRLMEPVTVRTRPVAPEKVRSIREYRLERDGELLVRGKTEWAVIEAATGRIHPMRDVFPEGLELAPAAEFDAPFARIDPDFTGAELLGTYRVRSTDVDIGGHMNNAAYVRAVFGLIGTKARGTMPQRVIDVIFLAPCFEDEELTVLRRTSPGIWDLAVLRPDGRPAVLIRAAGETR